MGLIYWKSLRQYEWAKEAFKNALDILPGHIPVQQALQKLQAEIAARGNAPIRRSASDSFLKQTKPLADRRRGSVG